MATTGRLSQAKRKRETDRKERQKEKNQEREKRKVEKATRPAGEQGEDPDIAGIVPGPQPTENEGEAAEDDAS